MTTEDFTQALDRAGAGVPRSFAGCRDGEFSHLKRDITAIRGHVFCSFLALAMQSRLRREPTKEDAQLAIAENKRLGVSDPLRDAMLLADYQEALDHLLEIGEHMSRTSPP
jgi:hypothetical protein